MTPIENESLAEALRNIKLLLWRLDLSKRTFTHRNDCPEVILSTENYRFFKDRSYRERLLHPDDRVELEQAINSFKERQAVQLVFRVQMEQKTHWYKMVGWPTDDFRYYDGVVEEISEQVHGLKNIFEQQNRLLLEDAEVPYPVALFLWPSCTLQKANLSFVEFLKLTAIRQKFQLKDLLISDINLPLLLEKLITGRHLTSELTLVTSDQRPKKANCRLEYFNYAGQSYLRLAVLVENEDNSLFVEQKRQHPPATEIAKLCSDLAGCGNIADMLERIFTSRNLFPGLDAVMYSDIYARKNQVLVYSKGALKEPLDPGSRFPYSGTIAENIANENLEYLIVDNTQSSIKAIDWMLFVPKGIYSYIAKALYVRGAMRTVLIFCSKRKNSFSEHQVGDITAIATAFHRQLKKIRRQNNQTFTPERPRTI